MVKKRLCGLLFLCTIILCTGCSYNVSFTPSENGGDIEVVETKKDDSTTAGMSTEAVTTKEIAVTEKELSTEENLTEEVSIDDYDCDYVSKAGVGFKCSESLKVNTDSEYGSDYSWEREDGMFDVSISNDEYSTLEECVAIWKSVYEDDAGEVIVAEDYTTTLSDDDAWTMVVQDNEYQFYTCVILIDAGSSIKEIKFAFNSEEGLSLFNEISESIIYLR